MKIPITEILNMQITQGDSRWIWVHFGPYSLRHYTWDDGFIEVCVFKEKKNNSEIVKMIGWVNGFFTDFEKFLSDLKSSVDPALTPLKARKKIISVFNKHKTTEAIFKSNKEQKHSND